MDVENPKLTLTEVPKAVKHSGRRGNPCSHASMDDVIAKPELSFSLKNIEGISVIPVAVWFDVEPGAEAKLEDFELRELGENPVVTRTTAELLSLVGGNVDAGHSKEYLKRLVLSPALPRGPIATGVQNHVLLCSTASSH